MLKVTVCITTYNLESYIEQTLNSILSQKTSFDFEILVGDDCSTDGTRNILLAYKEKYPDKITLHFQQNNVGVNKNDYELIYLSKGEYIAWCDGDDYWIDEYKLEKQVRFLDENPQYSCVHTLWRDFYESENRSEDVVFEQYDWEKRISGRLYIERLLTRQDSGCRFSSLLVRKKILLDFLDRDSSILVGIDHLQNDFAIFCMLVDVAPSFLLREVMVVYRIRKESLSQTGAQSKRYNYSLKGLNLTIYLLNKYKISHGIVQKTLHSTVSFVLYYMYKFECVDDLDKIDVQLRSIRFQYSLGQRMLILAIHYRWLYTIVELFINVNNRLKKCHNFTLGRG